MCPETDASRPTDNPDRIDYWLSACSTDAKKCATLIKKYGTSARNTKPNASRSNGSGHPQRLHTGTRDRRRQPKGRRAQSEAAPAPETPPRKPLPKVPEAPAAELKPQRLPSIQHFDQSQRTRKPPPDEDLTLSPLFPRHF